MPASPKPTCQPYRLREQSADERSDDRADVDADGENGEAARATVAIILGVQRTDLTRDISLEQPAADDQQHEREQERLVERHRDVTAAHEHRADRHGDFAADPAIGDESTEHRSEIHEAGVEPVDLRCEGECGHRAEHRLERVAQRGEAGDVLDVPGHEERLAHVEHEERGHAIVGEALPGLGEGEVGEADGLAEEGAAGGRGRSRGGRAAAVMGWGGGAIIVDDIVGFIA